MVLAGCAAPAKTENMVTGAEPEAAVGAHSTLRHSIWLADVRGGQAANAVIRSDVGNAELQQALIESLRANHLLADQPDEARFNLSAELTELNQPDSGTDLTVTSKIRYEVRAHRSNRQILSMTVSAPYTAQLSDSVIVFERMRLANEGSVRENIRVFIDHFVRELAR